MIQLNLIFIPINSSLLILIYIKYHNFNTLCTIISPNTLL